MSRDLSSVLPSFVSCVFWSRRCTGQPSDTVPAFYVSTVGISSANWTGKSGSFTGFNGTKVFHEYARSLYDVGNPNPTNQSILDTLAGQIAADFYNWHSLAFDIAYDGIAAPDPNGILDEIEWSHTMEGATTRIRTGLYNADPEELMHSDGPDNSGCVDNLSSTPPVIVTKGPYWEWYVPPAAVSGGNIQLPINLVCEVDGRFFSAYSRTDSMACGCPGFNPCTGHGNTLTFTLTGCGGLVAGATVTFAGSSGSYTTTTNGSGVATYNEPPPDTYTISWSVGGQSGSTAPITITSSCNSGSRFDGTSNHPSGYTACCPGLGPLYAPAVLMLTDPNGSYPMPEVGGPPWSASYVISNPPGYPPGSGLVVGYGLACDGTLGAVNTVRDSLGALLFECQTTVSLGALTPNPWATLSGTVPSSGTNTGGACTMIVSGSVSISA